MTNDQLYIMIGVPMVFNAVLIGLLIAYINSKLDGFKESVQERFTGVYQRLDAMNKRFDDMRDLWRAELHRVEEVLDARLKHLEER